jgi:hypothetical protein
MAGSVAVEEAVADARPLRGARVAALVAAAVVAYAAFFLAERALGRELPGAIKVGIPFLALPLAALWAWGERLELGRVDRTFLWSVAAYAPFAAWTFFLVRASPTYLPGLALEVATVPLALDWALRNFLHVGAIDFFTKRIVQREAALRWGAWPGFGVQVAAWSAGHVVEWTWLREMGGDVDAAVFLVSAGIVTGLAYLRWRNVAGLMVGHFLVNVALAAAALARA